MQIKTEKRGTKVVETKPMVSIYTPRYYIKVEEDWVLFRESPDFYPASFVKIPTKMFEKVIKLWEETNK